MLTPQEDSQNQLKDITDRFQSNFDIGGIYLLFNKSKLLIALFFLLSFIATFIYLRYSQPVFESKAVIQINNSITCCNFSSWSIDRNGGLFK